MTDQLRIAEDGRIVSQPVTWDGEPLYSEDSVREGLFDGSAFEQLAGQTAMPEPEPEIWAEDMYGRRFKLS